MKLDTAAGIGSNRRWPDGTPVYDSDHPLRLTAAEWRSWTRSRRAWRRRVASSIVLVVAVEAVAAVVYERLITTLDHPPQKTPA